ncbi:hypothetical protein KIW84_011553 [Lathyrus oleraceus]|uniref:Adenylosuccinate lyase PurB C-terminal domain-containing protein n=1 Tax=Pisum sativum TaxID=3888 RepID=A0A9D5BFB9_PEA|nr:hypothetical protein KIW84_011553 [Pisum sativum]
MPSNQLPEIVEFQNADNRKPVMRDDAHVHEEGVSDSRQTNYEPCGGEAAGGFVLLSTGDSSTVFCLVEISTVITSKRDLTDSTILRTMGDNFGHSLLAYKSTLQGIGKLQVNEARLSEDMNQCWEILAEPI